MLKASLIEANLERVEEALRSVNGLLTRGMDWGDIERLIKMERERGNVVAEIIERVQFTEGRMTLVLREEEEESDDEGTDESESDNDSGRRSVSRRIAQGIKIDVDLGLSAWANAREYFDRKKVAAEKVRTALPLLGVSIRGSGLTVWRKRGRRTHRRGP